MDRHYLLEIQKFLMAYDSPRAAHTALNARYNKIEVRAGVIIVGNITHIVYTYNMKNGFLPTNKTEREANGLVLTKDFETVSFGLPHVEVLADHNEASIRWADCWIEPDFRGIRFTVYRIGAAVFIQSGRDADLSTVIGERRLLYRKIIEALRNYSPDPTDPLAMFRGSDVGDHYTWTFELVENGGTSLQKIKAPAELVLISAWNKNFNIEVRRKYIAQFAETFGFITPLCAVVISLVEIRNILKWKVHQHERGVTVVDNYGGRLYVPKLPRRTPASRVLNAAENVTPEQLAKLVLSGTATKFEDENPVYSGCLSILRIALENILNEIDDIWIDLSGTAACQKHFAELAQDSMYAAQLFALWRGQATDARSILKYIYPGMLIWEVMYSQKLSFSHEYERLKRYLKSEEKEEELLHGVQNS